MLNGRLSTDALRSGVAGLSAAVQTVHAHFAVLAKGPPATLALLCVDDDPLQLQCLMLLARAQGLPAPQTFGSGAALLSGLQGRDTRGLLLVADLLMPQMDGVELIHQLGTLGFAGGVVLCSGADPSVVDAAQQLLDARGIRRLGPVNKTLTHEQLGDVWRAWQALNPAG